MTRIALDAIVFDADTQIRTAIDSRVVSDYADAMTNGAMFPPIVLFHDGTQHYLADGFHRFLAAQRNQWRDIDADVHAGTREDALWFALGANRTNGKRLTRADKTNAIRIAREQWPTKMQREIADQVGCHPSLVSEVYAKYARTTSSQGVLTGRYRKNAETREAVRTLISQGVSQKDIAKKTKASNSTIAAVRREMGLSGTVDKSRQSVKDRRVRMREMAAEGQTSRHIASELGLSEMGCRAILRAEGIDVPADKATRGTRRPESNRIVEQIVADAENLIGGVQWVDFRALEPGRVGDWIDSLIASKRALEQFIKRLIKERGTHGEAA